MRYPRTKYTTVALQPKTKERLYKLIAEAVHAGIAPNKFLWGRRVDGGADAIVTFLLDRLQQDINR